MSPKSDPDFWPRQEVDYLALKLRLDLGIQEVVDFDAVTISSFVYIRRKQEEDREGDVG